MRLRYLLLIGVGVFVVALFAHAPAAVIYGWAMSGRSDAVVRLYGIDGTVLSGRATRVSRGNQVIANDLQWSMRPASLLLGRAGYRLRTGSEPLLLDGSFAAGLGGIRLSALRASGELRALAAMAGQAFVPVNGQAGVDLDQLVLTDNWPAAAQGRVQILGLSWALGQPVVLGDFEAQLRTEDGEIIAAVSTLAGTVDVAGDARLKPDRSYSVDLQLRARPDAPPLVRNLLQSLGPADAQGYYRLKQSSQLAAPAPAAPAAVDPAAGEVPTFGPPG